MFPKYKHIHFVGIGGAGMSGLAEVLLNLGYRVSGSDLEKTPVTNRLANLGTRIYIGHQARQVGDADVVVVSSAIGQDNCEVVSARRKKIPVIPRAEMLAELMRLKYSIVVAGAHGKTTTTSMLAQILALARLDPTVIIGGKVRGTPSGARLGQGEYLVAEADESDGSFLKLTPTVAVVTNIDREHLDYYHNLRNIKKAFIEFINKVPFYGAAILSYDDAVVRSILPRVERKYFTYGFTSGADFKITGQDEVSFRGKRLGNLFLGLPGRHNLQNALSCIAVSYLLGISFGKVKIALREFKGVERRMQKIAEINDIIIMDDYGHHPTEIKATLGTIKKLYPERRLMVIFQPHRYTRTKFLFKEFARAFGLADSLILTDIYPAGESPLRGVSSKLITQELKRSYEFISPKEKIVDWLAPRIKSGDLVLTIGAGDIWKIARELKTKL